MTDTMTLSSPTQQLDPSNQQQSESVSPNASLYETSSNETGQISAANTSGVNMNSTLDSLVDNLEGLSPASNGSATSLGRAGSNGIANDNAGQFGGIGSTKSSEVDSFNKLGDNDAYLMNDPAYSSLLNTIYAANWSQSTPTRGTAPALHQSVSVPCGQQGSGTAAGANSNHFYLNDSGIDIGNLGLQIGLLNLSQAADSALFSSGAQKGSPRAEPSQSRAGTSHSGWPSFGSNANANELLASGWNSGQPSANAALMNMSRQTSGVSSITTQFGPSSSAQNSPGGEMLKGRSQRELAASQLQAQSGALPDGSPYSPLESQLLELIRAQNAGAGTAAPAANLFANAFTPQAQNGAPAAFGRSLSHSGASLGTQSLLGSGGAFAPPAPGGSLAASAGSASSLIDPNLLALFGRQAGRANDSFADSHPVQPRPQCAAQPQPRGRARGRAHAHAHAHTHTAAAFDHYQASDHFGGADRLGSHSHSHAHTHAHAHTFGASRGGGGSSATGFDRSGGGPVAGLLSSYQQAVAQSGVMQHVVAGGAGGAHAHGESRGTERYSRKVFVGGLPPDVDEDEIAAAFSRFGTLVVDWPHKAESKSYFPPKGYCFLLFHDEASVHALLEACVFDCSKYYWVVSSPTVRDKPVQIRPWELADSDCVMDPTQTLDPRKTIFVGGVPRPLKAAELAMIMDRYYGNVCYAGIDTDPELKYPKGAGRVAFSSQQSYIAAISARFVQLQIQDIDKRVEVKPYVLDDQMCDECGGARCGGKYAPFFCGNVTCLQYYCEFCWAAIHSRPGREYHKPLVKEGADRPRAIMPPFSQRW